MRDADRPIGIFDSGVGGISVLSQVRALLPAEHLLYYGDNAWAPYGTRSPEQVLERTWVITRHLLESGAKALLIACNTATSVAAPSLREALTIPVVGMEPALKPASARRHGGNVLVLATPVTLALPKFAALMARYGEGAVPLPCAGLMEFAERGELTGAALHAHVAALLGEWPRRTVDAVVLGCTHYIYLRPVIASFFAPGTPIVDGNLGTARQLARLLAEHGLLCGEERPGTVTLETSGEQARVLAVMRRLLAVGVPA